MAKTQAPSEIEAASGTFVTNAAPDPFDDRDLEYRARLAPLPSSLDSRATKDGILNQGDTSSCTGHALAAVINTIKGAPWAVDDKRKRPKGDPPEVSPYMLYHLARRYDEYDGEADIGSSLRGAFKGWFNHGVVPRAEWSEIDSPAQNRLEDKDFQSLARENPLGAFYRVNAFRLDDMQSAINELNAICCSAAVHSGWKKPKHLKQGKREMYVILRPGQLDNLGGHAFAMVGYNDVGFLVQNSWGKEWGKGGFATLPYDDWLDSAWDAWVARPGVPKTPSYRGRTNAITTSGEVGTAPGPDVERLRKHVVNLENNGKLSDRGKFHSTPSQIEQIFEHMEERHDEWQSLNQSEPRRIVFYAHGGLNKEATGLKIAAQHRGWWLNNHVYPIYFAWQSGAVETMIDDFSDLADAWLPFGTRGFDALEAFDGLIEKGARRIFKRTWEEMKENAILASADDPNRGSYRWPPPDVLDPEKKGPMNNAPGGTLTVHRLAEYIKEHKGTEVHLAGHSAGSIFLAELFKQLHRAKIDVTSMSFMAPALRVDVFRRELLPELGRSIKRFAVIGLSKEAELDDVCGSKNVDVYHKSLLYLVSRAFEEGRAEVPLLGMEKFMDEREDEEGRGVPLVKSIEQAGGACFFAPSNLDDAEDSRSNATSHGGLDDDSPTMTSVMLRVLDLKKATTTTLYRSSVPETTPVKTAASRSVSSGAGSKLGEGEEPQPAAAMVETDGESHSVGTAPPGEEETPSPVELMLADEGWRSGEPEPAS